MSDAFEMDLAEARTAAEKNLPEISAFLADQARTLQTVETISYEPPPSFTIVDYMGSTPYQYTADDQVVGDLRAKFEEYLGDLTGYMSRAASVTALTGLALRQIVDLYARADGQG